MAKKEMWSDETALMTIDTATPAHEPLATMTRADESGTMGLMMRAAQSISRDPGKLINRAKQIGGLMGAIPNAVGQGTAAFYRFPAGGGMIEGITIGLAQALAQEWGGIAYQVRVLRAEPLASGSQRIHFRATVTDLRTVICCEVDQVATTIPPPGKFADNHAQSERWNGMQAQSAASKIVRNALVRVLPAWYVEAALRAALEVAAEQALGNHKSLPEARAAAIDALGSYGCTVAELEAHTGHPPDLWAIPQLADLRSLFLQIKGGAISVESWRESLVKAAAPPPPPVGSALGIAKPAAAPPVDKARMAADQLATEAAQAEERAAAEKVGDGYPVGVVGRVEAARAATPAPAAANDDDAEVIEAMTSGGMGPPEDPADPAEAVAGEELDDIYGEVTAPPVADPAVIKEIETQLGALFQAEEPRALIDSIDQRIRLLPDGPEKIRLARLMISGDRALRSEGK